jgi:cytochrome d ubiquinol oxidase subunit I
MSMAEFDRFLFAYTIGSHIILVSASIGLILLIAILEIMKARKINPNYDTLLGRLKKVFVISFGVGTASGIVMAVELINLFPTFMTLVSETGVIAAFYAEIFTFFLETIALVIYVYYDGAFKWKYTNIALSITIATGTILSAVFITMVNAWMNTPNGFNIATYLSTGVVTGVNPWAPFATASTFSEIAHVVTTTVFAGMMMLGVFFAIKYLRSREPGEKSLAVSALHIIGVVSIIDIVLVGISGSHAMSTLLTQQPVKYAAIDLNYLPGSNMPEKLFGSLVNGNVVGAITIPSLQSILAGLETNVSILPGLSAYPQSLWPPLLVHTTFDTMVVGGLLIGLYLFIMFLMFVLKKDPMHYRIMIILQIIVGIFAFIVYELGWVTDEVGRQPWIVYNVLTVNNAINPSTALLVPGFFIVAFYLVLVPATFYFFSRIYSSKKVQQVKEESVNKGGVNY